MQGTRAFSRGAIGESDLSSCCEGKLDSKVLLQGNKALSRVEGELGVLWTSRRNLSVPLLLQ